LMPETRGTCLPQLVGSSCDPLPALGDGWTASALWSALDRRMGQAWV